MREPAASLELLACSAIGSCDQRATALPAGGCAKGWARCRIELRFDTIANWLLHIPDHAKQCLATDQLYGLSRRERFGIAGERADANNLDRIRAVVRQQACHLANHAYADLP